MVPGAHCRSPPRYAQNDDCRPRAQTAHRTLALCHHWRGVGGRRLTASGLKGGLTGTSITTELFGARTGFQCTAELTIRGDGKPRFELALMPTGRMVPPPGASPSDARDCIMVRTSTNLPNTSLRREKRLNCELPSDHTRYSNARTPELRREKAPRRSSSLRVLRRQGAAKHKRR
jgi:hypothetical protein